MTTAFSGQWKSFGVGVDAADDPWTLRLKHAAMNAQENGVDDLCADPYAALNSLLMRDTARLTAGGRFKVPDWLRPIPPPAARQRVSQANMAQYISESGMWHLALEVKEFVRNTIFPDMPLMLGVDHAMTGGVLGALTDRIGPDRLSIIILDQHFDGLPLSQRVDTTMIPAGDDAYCCGNFLKHLIDGGIILAENLLFIGVADYPRNPPPPGGETFRDNYLALEERGCRFFPAPRFEGDYQHSLMGFITTHVTTPYVYVSLDMDVGAHQCVHAARYMDTSGISRQALQQAAGAIANGIRRGDFRLIGLDAMEFNMHFLGLEYEPGKKDATLTVAQNFLTTMLAVPTGLDKHG